MALGTRFDRSGSFNMAQEQCAVSDAKGDVNKAGEKDDYDPTLDFFSDKFDPLKALNTPGLKPPVDSALPFDNLSQYESKQITADRPSGGKKKEKEQAVLSEVIERRWLPHQLPVQGKRKAKKNILTRMETITGPLKVLKKCMDEKLLIKVWTRNAAGIRGYCTGYVTAFDKHWNLSLQKVTEVWTRIAKRKIPSMPEKEESQGQKSRNKIKLPEIRILKRDKNTETCLRNIPQILVRGEQIALISVVSGETT